METIDKFQLHKVGATENEVWNSGKSFAPLSAYKCNALISMLGSGRGKVSLWISMILRLGEAYKIHNQIWTFYNKKKLGLPEPDDYLR